VGITRIPEGNMHVHRRGLNRVVDKLIQRCRVRPVSDLADAANERVSDQQVEVATLVLEAFGVRSLTAQAFGNDRGGIDFLALLLVAHKTSTVWCSHYWAAVVFAGLP